MKQPDYLTGSPFLTKFYGQLHKYVVTKRKRDTYLDNLVESKPVKRFENRVREALLTQYKDLPNRAVQEAVESIQKISQADLIRVRAIIDKEFGSFDGFLNELEITTYLTDVYNTGANHAIDKAGLTATFELKNPDVVAQLKDQANFLISSVDETTKDEIASRIVRGVEQGMSWQDIANEISDKFPDIASYRAELIARMETANAVNRAELDFYKKNGLETKRWVLAGSHSHDDECDDNASDGSINVNDTFSSGDDAPPAHVNCMCVLETDFPADFIENGPSWLGE